MAADVSSLVRILNGYIEDQQQPKIPITRDLLGGCSKLGSNELDLDSQVPNGWEKRLDLKSGKVYLQRCNSPISPASEAKPQQKPVHELQDLNLPPSYGDESLDLKLFPANEYQSVCTLDKVKSALERAERESGKKRYLNCSSSDLSPSRICSSRSSPSSPSVRGGDVAGDGEEEKSSDSFESGLVFAAGCPSCLLYVLISKANPKCPRCDTVVPVRSLKKPRVDLNASLA